MAALASVRYDPGTAATASCASLLAMTALDTTNLRVTFTAPSNGIVFVSARVTLTPASAGTANPTILLGVLDGATVRLRGAPTGQGIGIANYSTGLELAGLVTGLTPGNSYTWDLAYGVETLLASTNISYGGPNDTTGNDAWGAATFEVWATNNLLAGTQYDPSTAASKSLTALSVMAAMDTTNLRLTFTAPASGFVKYRLRVPISGGSNPGTCLLGALEGASVVARGNPVSIRPASASTTTIVVADVSSTVAVSAGSHTWDAAWACQIVGSGGGTSAIRYGGPNDTTAANAYGGVLFAIWAA